MSPRNGSKSADSFSKITCVDFKRDESMDRLGKNVPLTLAISSRWINIRLFNIVCCDDRSDSILDIVTHTLPVEAVSKFRRKEDSVSLSTCLLAWLLPSIDRTCDLTPSSLINSVNLQPITTSTAACSMNGS